MSKPEPLCLQGERNWMFGGLCGVLGSNAGQNGDLEVGDIQRKVKKGTRIPSQHSWKDTGGLEGWCSSNPASRMYGQKIGERKR